jgi:hypothetical protein
VYFSVHLNRQVTDALSEGCSFTRTLGMSLQNKRWYTVFVCSAVRSVVIGFRRSWP